MIKRSGSIERHEPGYPCANGGHSRRTLPVPIFTMHLTQRPGEAALFGRYNLAAYDEMFASCRICLGALFAAV